MSDNIATFLLANSGGQPNRGLLSAPEVAAGHRGVPDPYATVETAGSTSIEAFSRILEGQSRQGDSVSPGLKRAFQTLTQAIEEFVRNAGKEPFSTTEITQLRQPESGQTLPVVGNFLPEKTLQQLQALLDPSADTDHVLPDHARQRIQQLLDVAGNLNAAGSVLPAVPITTSSASIGLSNVNGLRDRMATTTTTSTSGADSTVTGAIATGTIATGTIATGTIATGTTATGTTTEDIAAVVTGTTVQGTAAAITAATAKDAAVTAITTSTATTLKTNAQDIAITARLGETMQQIAQVLRTAMSRENTSKPVETMTMADMVKSSRLLSLGSRSGSSHESRSVPLSVLSQAHRPAQSVSAILNDGENIDSNLFLRAGLDQQSQSVRRFNAIQPTADKIMEQASARAQSLSPARTNIQTVEARDLPPMLWATADASLKPGADVQSVNMRTGIGIQESLQNPEWGRELGSRVVWMTKQQLQTANIKVNPPHLGPIEVRVVVQNDIANVSFISQHAAVRDVIESSVPRLREMLSDNGLNLGNVDVDDHSSAREHQRQANAENDSLSSFRNASAQLANETELEGSGSAMNVSITQLGEGLIDYYV